MGYKLKCFGDAVPQRIGCRDVAVTNVSNQLIQSRLGLRNRDVDARAFDQFAVNSPVDESDGATCTEPFGKKCRQDVVFFVRRKRNKKIAPFDACRKKRVFVVKVS